MAEVFLARDGRLDRDVAIKVLRPDKAADGVVRRRRFATEGRAAAGLSHPNVVGVYDVGEDRGNPYLVMELVAGGTLAERIASGPLSEDAVHRVGLDLRPGWARPMRRGSCTAT
jgi:eukaryotic-like serine/threonine-protein kinase